MADKITDIIDQSAFKQVEDLTKNLKDLNELMVKTIDNSIKLNSSVGNASGIVNVSNAIDKQATALKKVTEIQTQFVKSDSDLRKAEEDLANSLRASGDALNQKQKAELEAQLSASEWAKANATVVESNEKVGKSIDDLRKEKLGEKLATDDMIRAEKELVKVEISVANSMEKAKNQNILLRAERDKLDLSTKGGIARHKELNKQIDANTAFMKKNGDTSQKQAMNIGNYTGSLKVVWGALRQIAYILPGIGIAGIFNLAGEAIGNVIEKMGLLNDEAKEYKETMVKGNQGSVSEVNELERLYATTQDVTVSINERKLAIDKLQEIYPTYFGNIKDENILNGDAITTYLNLRDAIVATAKSKAIKTKIDEIVSNDMETELELIEKQTKALEYYNKNKGKKIAFQGGMGGVAYEEDINRINAVKFAEKELSDFYRNQNKKLKIYEDALKETQKITAKYGDPYAKAPKEKKAPKAKTEPKGAEVNRIAELKKQYEREQKELEISYKKNDMTEEEYYLQSIKKTKEFFKERVGLSKKEHETEIDFNLQLKNNAENYYDKLEGINKGVYDSNYKLMKDLNEATIESSKNILDNEEATLQEKLKANMDYFTAKTDLLDLEEAKEIKNAKGNQIVIDSIQLKYQNERLIQYKTFNKQKGEIIESEADKEMQKELEKFDKLKEQYDNYSSDALRDLDETYAKGLMSTQEYEKQRLYISQNANQNSLKAQLAYAENLLKSGKITGKKRVELEKEVSKLRNAIAKTDAEIQQDIFNDNFKKLEENLKIFEQYAKGVYDLASSINSILVDSTNRDADKRIENIDKVEEAELASLERISMSAKEKEEARLQIEINAESKRNEINNERIKRLRKLAAVQKALDVMNIITGTASAVVSALGAKPWTPLNIALASGIALTGAGQLAKAIATPLPQYAKGIESTPTDSFAIVGEKGTELITEKSGKQYLTPDTDTLTYLPKGTKVTPHHELMANVYDNAHKYMANSSSISTDTMQTALIQSFEELYNKVDNLTEIMAKKNMNVSIFGDYEHAMRIKKSRM